MIRVFATFGLQPSQPWRKQREWRTSPSRSLPSSGPWTDFISWSVIANTPRQACCGPVATNAVSKAVSCQQTIFARYGECAQAAGRSLETLTAVATALRKPLGTCGFLHSLGFETAADVAGAAMAEPMTNAAATNSVIAVRPRARTQADVMVDVMVERNGRSFPGQQRTKPGGYRTVQQQWVT